MKNATSDGCTVCIGEIKVFLLTTFNDALLAFDDATFGVGEFNAFVGNEDGL